MAPPRSWILSEAYAGLQSQALGLAERAGLTPDLRVLAARPPWSWLPARLWPAPLAVAGAAVSPPVPPLVIGCGGMAAAVGARLRRPGCAVVQVQNPRMDLARFDLVVANRHDELAGPNVIVTRTALHRVSSARLAAARAEWAGRFAHLPRPLVAVLVGGTNGRFRLDAAVAADLAAGLAAMMRADRVGLILTPSRRTDPVAARTLRETLAPLGADVWDGSGENPYFGMLALADAIVVTIDSVSMVSEAAATAAPVLLAGLPGRSRRIGLFLDGLRADGRVRDFAGRLETWPVAAIDDTEAAAAEMRRRLGF
ncbi:MAG TPA: mitochondrial fission ELM1 family protein [Acetobacteraceae bacterium]|nr:mitochondrial fission ELM1 family protein [Acetobacteraceae bacterium]